MKKLFLLLFSLSCLIIPQGKVYFVLCSDTAIWDGMNTSWYNCFYNVQLFSDATANAAKVMNPEFRKQFRDSYNQTLKMTWYMMAGNIYRFADNKNVPVPNLTTMHVMKKYQGDNVQIDGDELSLHYHTFSWYDYNGDGLSMWNQAQSFNDCRNDFDVTLAQMLIEENEFPVTFRSGWHYMDNDWQNYINDIIPITYHNDYPNKNIDTEEPIDNDYDWSKATGEFVPFHPSKDNYQLAGDLKTLNNRSIYMSNMSQSMMNTVFQKAKNGVDQVVALWAHLPEDNFPDNIKRIDSVIHVSANLYPDVKFRYCTGHEAYRLWKNSQDTTKPTLTVTPNITNNKINYNIKSDEPIFQKIPFVAIKDKYENYKILNCQKLANNEWQTEDISYDLLAKAGFAITDTSGNLSTKVLTYTPEDFWVDNSDAGYKELNGGWYDGDLKYSHNQSSRLSKGDASFSMDFTVPEDGLYNVFDVLSTGDYKAAPVKIYLKENSIVIDSVTLNSPEDNKYNFIGQHYFNASKSYSYLFQSLDPTSYLSFDGIKFSRYIPSRYLCAGSSFVDLGEIIQHDTLNFDINLQNRGSSTININNITSNIFSVVTPLPMTLNGGEFKTVKMRIIPDSYGNLSDTLRIANDDPSNTEYKIPIQAIVSKYFAVIDNEDSSYYVENGSWNKSNAQAYKTSSRFAYMTSGNLNAYATFTKTVQYTGYYSIREIVPNSQNSVVAKYLYKVNNVLKDSVVFDQDNNSGVWIDVFRNVKLNKGDVVQTIVKYAGTTTSGDVLRADAVKYQFIDTTASGIDEENTVVNNFTLYQNYPNPFNPSTIISFNITQPGRYKVEVFNLLGEKVSELLNRDLAAGKYSVNFNARGLATGVYIYTLRGNNILLSKKMTLIK